MLKRKNPSPESKQKINYEQIGRMVANIYETGYIDRNQAYKMSFIKGILAGFGGVVGATLVVGAMVGIMSLPVFKNLPPVEWVRTSIENGTN